MSHADDTVPRDYTPTHPRDGCIDPPERIGIREQFAQPYPPRAEKVPRITHVAKRNGRAPGVDGESFSDIEAAGVALRIGLQCKAIRGQSARPARGSSCSLPFGATVT
jgi:hypothetical protein